MIKRLIAVYMLLFTICTFAQERNINDILDYTLSYRGLTRQDVTIPIEFFTSAEKSPTNDAKLMLPLVRDIMVNPLRSMTWLDSVMLYTGKDLTELITEMFQQIGYGHVKGDHKFSFTSRINDILDLMEERVEKSHTNEMDLLKVYSMEELKFLQENLFSITEEDDNDDASNFDIFKFNIARDSSIKTSKKAMELLSRINMDKIANENIEDFFFCYELFKYVSDNTDLLNRYYDSYKTPNRFGVTLDIGGRKIIIGGKENNIYSGDYAFIIDLGGDDVYNIERPTPSRKGEPPLQGGELSLGGFSCIIDLSGNDFYTTSSDFALAGGLFSSSFIFDKEGDDIYESKGSGNLGAAIGGLGLIYDEKGNDTYKSISFSIGAGCFGVGLIVDREGNDFYIANSYSEGFGMTEGVGAIVDNKGNDSYLVDARSLDIGRYNDHYVSMCQGYGLGLRPYYAGGIGLIIEGEGNDIYNTDIFGQGGAYWYSLGAIVDKSGHDKYNSYQYAQGSGVHLAVGLLKDYDGWDFYQSDGVSQGCGHDFGFGMLWDVKGNDNYSAYSLSQGAGNADGIGIFIDESGKDGYLNKYPANTRGYGNPRREYGSLGIFIDASGEDYYSQPGYDSTLMNSSTWGVMNDFYLTDLPSQVSGDNFKVSVDSVNRPHDIPFSIDQYFIMAKTIEPRFSLWQAYGFRKLIDDSIGTAGYILTKLGTEDAREVQVMRVLSQKMQKPVADALLTKLNEYVSGKSNLTQPEVSFACYIFGETRNPLGKDVMLQLTYNENYRIRSSAINTLGKIKYDITDTGFINKVCARLKELAAENSEKKLYRKDITFSFNNYKQEDNIPVLIDLLKDNYYGVRFLSAEALRSFGERYMRFINNPTISKISDEYKSMNAFLYSLNNLPEGNFKSVIDIIQNDFGISSGLLNENLIDTIRLRRSKSVDLEFIKWCDYGIGELQKKIILKVK